MKILVVNAHSFHTSHDFPAIFKKYDRDCEVSMLCSSRHGVGAARNAAAYKQIWTLDNFDKNPRVEELAYKICSEGIDAIVAANERDILLAAQLRSLFGISGLQHDEALRFRDKVKMKKAVSSLGFCVPRFKALDSALTAYDFAARSGYPLILKPRRQAGALGIAKIDNPSDLTERLADVMTHRDDEMPYMLEEFIEGPMFSINGFVTAKGQGVFWSNVVKGNWLGLANRKGAVLDYVMPASHPFFGRLQDYGRRMVSALQLRNTAFHLEVFWNERTRHFVFCEIAVRGPGLLIAEAAQTLFGFDIHEVFFLLQAGLATDELEKVIQNFNPKTHRLSGYFSVPARSGLLVKAPTDPKIPGVKIEKMVKQGNEYSAVGQITSLALLALLEGESEDQLMRKSEDLLRWYEQEFIWQTT